VAQRLLYFEWKEQWAGRQEEEIVFFASMVSLMEQTQTIKPINRAASSQTNPVDAQLEALTEVYTEEVEATRELYDVSARFERCYTEIRNLIVVLRDSEPGSRTEEAVLEQIKAKREEIRALKREMDHCYRGVKFVDTGDGHSTGPTPEVPLFFDSSSMGTLN
jgi:DNA repair ATPase RecN